MIITDHNCVVNMLKQMPNNLDLELVTVNAYAKFGQIPSMCSEDIERKEI